MERCFTDTYFASNFPVKDARIFADQFVSKLKSPLVEEEGSYFDGENDTDAKIDINHDGTVSFKVYDKYDVGDSVPCFEQFFADHVTSRGGSVCILSQEALCPGPKVQELVCRPGVFAYRSIGENQ